MSPVSFAAADNRDLLEDAYARWQKSPSSLDPTWQAFFAGVEFAGNGAAPKAVPGDLRLQTGVPAKPVTPADNGMQVRRRYLDRHGKPLAGGVVRSGDLVQVELTVSSPTVLENLVVEDLLPGGLEVENPRLERVTGMPGWAAGMIGTASFGLLVAGIGYAALIVRGETA